ncbi:hypothetical protein HNS03_24085 [Amorphus sp. 3PC139-8]
MTEGEWRLIEGLDVDLDHLAAERLGELAHAEAALEKPNPVSPTILLKAGRRGTSTQLGRLVGRCPQEQVSLACVLTEHDAQLRSVRKRNPGDLLQLGHLSTLRSAFRKFSQAV